MNKEEMKKAKEFIKHNIIELDASISCTKYCGKNTKKYEEKLNYYEIILNYIQQIEEKNFILQARNDRRMVTINNLQRKVNELEEREEKVKEYVKQLRDIALRCYKEPQIEEMSNGAKIKIEAICYKDLAHIFDEILNLYNNKEK